MSDHQIVIVGAGFSGLGAAIKLKEQGHNDFVIIDRAEEVGGTWEINTYPGCRCDVPSNIYSYSFAPNPDWSQAYSPQPEIWDYLRRTADEAGLRPHLRLGCEMVSAVWDDDAALWRLESSDGPVTAKILISAIGGLVEPSLPPIEGIADFKGEMFHSARWDHDVDLTGKRVAVIGTGASGVQIVPNIAKRVAHLDVFQRTAPWIPPHPNRRTSRFERALYRRLPFTQKLARGGVYAFFEPIAVGMTLQPKLLKVIERLCRAHLRRQVPDPALRAKLTPDYLAGCKRLTPSNAYYPTLMREDVDLVTEPIARFTAKGIVTADGLERELDAVVLATGFEVQDPPGLDRVIGRGGRSIKETWREGGLRGHLGLTIAGFPNLFTVLGPNTGTGHQSIIYMIESQLNYVLDALRIMEERELAAIEVKPEALDAFNRWVQERSKRTVWLAGGCNSWYVDDRGHNTTIWPSFTFTFRRRTRRLDLEEYTLRPAVPAASPPAAEPEILTA
jgi:cation diffusion facilitator CzcD-associated flavoprotein CzcO